MRDDASGGERPGDAGPDQNDGPGGTNGNTGSPSQREPETAGVRRPLVIAAFVAAAVAFTAVGFGATTVIRDQIGTASASSAIPAPPAANQVFVEDDDGTGADSQQNILQSTVPGLVRIASPRGAGSGVVLTPSGLVLTSAQVAGSKGTVSAKVAPSGRSYTARLIETDAVHDLTLLQLEGGRAFRTVAIGNSRDFAVGAAAISVSTSATGRAFTLAIGNVTAISTATTIGGHRLAGLMQTTAQLVPGQSAGGPLVNLSGQVIGIDLAGSAHGTSITSYAIPIDEALAVARQLRP
jgi:S1-C subfamily serine protease